MLTVWRSTRVDFEKLQSSRFQMFYKIDGFKNFAEFTGKRSCRSFFQIELQMTVPETADIRSFLEII